MPKSATTRVAGGEQDVLGLDVAVDDAVLVRVAQGVGDLARDADRLRGPGAAARARAGPRSDSPST